MKERIIEVDYREPITKNGMWEFQITIVEGLKFLGSNKVVVKDFNEIFNILCVLSISDKTTGYRLQEIKCLERKLKEAKDSL